MQTSTKNPRPQDENLFFLSKPLVFSSL